jgi:hypothetical protein
LEVKLDWLAAYAHDVQLDGIADQAGDLVFIRQQLKLSGFDF